MRVTACLRRSRKYSALLLAGSQVDGMLHAHSDIDLYAVSVDDGPEGWFHERVDAVRVELTARPLGRWREMLATSSSNPMHHHSFAHGRVLWDPDDLLPPLAATGAATLDGWRSQPGRLARARYGLEIQRDRLLGYAERGRDDQVRYHAIGVVHVVTEALVLAWDVPALTGGKNLDRVLGDPRCSELLRDGLHTLLSGAAPEVLVATHAAVIDETLRATAAASGSPTGIPGLQVEEDPA